MTRLFRAASLLVLLAGAAPLFAQATMATPPAGSAAASGDDLAAQNLREEMRKVVLEARDKVFPALVNISVITVNYATGQETKGGATGSGSIISKDGYVVTNHHVVEGGKKFKVTLADRQEIPAKLVGDDPLTDLAVLQIDTSKLAPGTSLAVANWGDSKALTIGDTVMAMGSPFALSRSVTLGIVSNADRVFTGGGGDDVEEMQFDPGQRTGIFTRWIQHDAAINPGNSGGPLVNLQGQIVGINTLGGSNMGFAIPAALARPVAESLIAKGEVIRSYVGVSLKSIKRSDFKEGVVVNSTVKEGPADKAGLQAGDLITAFDGKPITARFPEEIPAIAEMIANLPVGAPLKVTYKHDGVEKTTTITTEKLLRDKGDEAALRGWGISAQEITEKMARDRQLDSTEGVIVSGLHQGGPADLAEPSITWGDVIHSVDGQPIKTLDELVEKYRAIMSKDPIPEFVMVGFDRRGKNQVTLLKPRPDKKEDPPREIPKAWLGVATQPVLKDLADKLGMPGSQGFRVSRVYPNTLAAKSDLKVGDVIVAVNGAKTQPRSTQEAGLLQRAIRRLNIDDKATLTVMREGKQVEVPVTLERTRIAPEEALRDQNKDFDLTVRELTFFDRDDNRWDDSVQGVVVENADRAGWAGLAGIGPGDLIQRINDAEITDIPTYRKAMDDLAKKQPTKVTFYILRGTRTFVMFAEPDWKPKTKQEEQKEEAK
ncbi:MAG: PDZ domain-containing protein [Tepidisphaera sp.]|nr:PDZ domain-containing protein [Tepidisphaera sp.]